ncbi:hypothetical protein ROHU_006753 [Labeo rohita]|uniref:HECT domain-containing protein n=1 Tax=Labeo rohita TaxID=84645 RepID=A0A498MNL7_LABRO|nr:hypothetical protein ROHU_006753 [Labeo rohita]
MENQTGRSQPQEDDLLLVEEATSSRQSLSPKVGTSNFEHQVLEAQCPICSKTFLVSELEMHASFCGESEEDVIHLAAQIDTMKIFEVCVSRENMLERGLKLWKRQKTGSPVNPLKITFLGEPGVDTGALRKEFLSTMVASIEKRLFEGDANKGKMPKYSLNDMDNELFKALELHITTKRIPMLQQLREGLEIYDLTKVMQRKPRECHDLFVIGYDDQTHNQKMEQWEKPCLYRR